MSVLKFGGSGSDALDEAHNIANDSIYGLVGGVFSADSKITNHVVRRLQCGQVNVNTYFAMAYDGPFGGMKQSGIGREMSMCGLNNYLEEKTVYTDYN